MSETWWNTEHWHAYEEACGDEPGTRAAVLEDADWQTRVVDLSLSTDDLWADVRKSYHSLINGKDEEYPEQNEFPRRKVYHGSGGKAGVAKAEQIHFTAAGRATRPAETWSIMADWVEDARGLVVVAEHLEPLGYSYWMIHDGWSYYHSAAALERDVGLALIWWGMLALRGRDVRWCEIGWQGQAQDDKGENIEFVRRGFGGRDVPVQLSGRALTEEEWDEATD